MQQFQPLTPPALERVLQTCLEKDPDKRWQSAREVKHALEWIATETPTVPAPAPTKRSWLWPSVAVVLAIALGVTAWALWPKAASTKVTRFEIPLPENVSFSQYVSLSPDGRKLAFNATGEQSGLWIRDLDALTWRHLADTQDAVSPFWSPDSRFVGFGVGNQLKKVDVSGGPAQTLCDTATPVGSGAWNQDGVVIFGHRGNGPLQRVSQAGGVPAEITVVDSKRGETFHALPTFLPDGKHFLYLRQGTDPVKGMYIGSLDLKPAEQSKERLLAGQFAASYVDGYLFFMRENTLMAQPFDAGKLQLQGEPVPVVEHVATTQSIGMFSVSPSGALAYRTGAGGNDYQLTWFDRQGKVVGTLGQPGPNDGVSLSPDGTRAAVRDAEGRALGDIWTLDSARGVRTRLTFRRGPGSSPVWSPEGSRIVFSAGNGVDVLYEKPSSGAGDEKELFKKTGEIKVLSSWSRDGRFLFYTTVNNPTTGNDLWVLPMEGDHKPVLLLGTPLSEAGATLSPDMHWLAYQSDETNRGEIYVRPFLASGPSGVPALGEGKWQVSKDGGNDPKWRADGKEIIFQAPPNGTSKMAVDVKVNGAAFEPGIPQELFRAPLDYGWDVTADGKRFLLSILPVGQQTARTPITVLLNWQAELKKK